MRGTRAVIHLDNLRGNVREIRRFVRPGARMCVAVKADAYGHGAVQCAMSVLEAGADMLAVATVGEGQELRSAGIDAPTLMLSLCAPGEVAQAVEANLTPLVFDREYIDLFAKEAALRKDVPYPVHLAVDTGMGRIGCYPGEAAGIARYIRDSGVLTLGGMCTHFAVSDDTQETSRQFTHEQFRQFCAAIDAVRGAGIDPGICHCANSAATLDLPETHLGMVRPGIIVYGYGAEDVSVQYLAQKGTPITLKPVMTLETVVSAIRHFEAGKSAGYGRTWVAGEPTDIAVLPVGYADGWVRRFALAGVPVGIHGKEYPVRGRICMDQCMVDLGANNADVHRWDTAVLFGDPADGAVRTAADIARATGTISYEVTSCITKRVPRVFVG